MNWEKLDIHIENLAPILATIWALSLFWKAPDFQSDASKVFLGIALLVVAYLAGVLVNVLCRAHIDPLSECCSRVVIFKLFSRTKLRDMAGASREDINNAYTSYCSKAITEAKDIAKEVAKRRQTGRLIRFALLPVLLVQLHISVTEGIAPNYTIVAMIAQYIVLLSLYGYAEATILTEAYHAVPENERSVKAIKTILQSRGTEPAFQRSACSSRSAETRRSTMITTIFFSEKI